MEFWQCFTTRKQQGEWVELQFMAQAAAHRLGVNKPWADMGSYDIGVEYGENFLRVQVKGTTQQVGGGYRCQMRPKHRKLQTYAPNKIDLFAAYVIPSNAWYIIPSVVILAPGATRDLMLCPIGTPKKKASYRYESYREAWELLTKTRSDLASLERQSDQ
jgi:hypothetical protein